MANQTIYNCILERIRVAEPESIFVSTDYVDLADVNTVRQCLSRMEQTGELQRIMRGVYYRPVFSQLLGEYEAPSPHHVAQALARKFNWSIAPSGATALNLLGLSTQVPAKWSYISDGPYHKFNVGKLELEFKHRSNREISGLSYKSAMVIQALRALGKENVDDTTIKKLQRLLTDHEKQALLQEAQQAVAWIYNLIKKICRED